MDTLYKFAKTAILLFIAVFLFSTLFLHKKPVEPQPPAVGEYTAHEFDYSKYSDFVFSSREYGFKLEIDFKNDQIRMYNNAGKMSFISVTDSVRFSGTLPYDESAKIFFDSIIDYYKDCKKVYKLETK